MLQNVIAPSQQYNGIIVSLGGSGRQMTDADVNDKEIKVGIMKLSSFPPAFPSFFRERERES